MKNKPHRQYQKARREKIAKLMENPEKFKEKMGSEITEKDVGLIHEIARDARLDELFDDLNINKDQLEHVKKQIIKLSPKSVEYPLFSTLFRDHDGNYKVEDLINEYHDSILREGMLFGMDYGKKFLAEDIQSKRFTKEDLMNMTQEEIIEYGDEIRDEI
jgi:hypothetical protein